LATESKLLVLSRRLAEQYVSDEPWACISITDNEDRDAKINKCQLQAVLRLKFEDVNLEGSESFSDEQANQVLDFVKEWWDKIETLVVHCYAGQCRSPAIAAIISKIYYGDDMFYLKRFTPNTLVFRKLYCAVNARDDFENIR